MGIQNKKRKTITPIIATILLLFASMAIFFLVQDWFEYYTSSFVADIDKDSDVNLKPEIKRIVDGNLYFNNNRDNLVIKSLKIGNVTCGLTQFNYDRGIHIIDVENCTKDINDKTPEVVIITDEQVLSKTIVLLNDNINPSPVLDCSTLNGGEWISVQGNIDLGTSDFCVMKYEAKNNGGIPNSTTSGKPWVSISQTDAMLECESLGEGYRLMSDAEWVTIARNVENIDSNWNSSVVGIGFMFSGHNDDGPSGSLNASSNDSDGYYRTNDNLTNCDGAYYNFAASDDVITGRACAGQRRTLKLSNGGVIWDLGGNVWEWNSDTLNTTGIQNSSLGTSNSNWYQWNTISGYSYLKSSDITLNSNNGIGSVYTDTTTASPSGDVHAFNRGGDWGNGDRAGAFALCFYSAPSHLDSTIGFRCVYSP